MYRINNNVERIMANDTMPRLLLLLLLRHLQYPNNFSIPRSTVNAHLSSFFPITIRLWNSLPGQSKRNQPLHLMNLNRQCLTSPLPPPTIKIHSYPIRKIPTYFTFWPPPLPTFGTPSKINKQLSARMGPKELD